MHLPTRIEQRLNHSQYLTQVWGCFGRALVKLGDPKSEKIEENWRVGADERTRTFTYCYART